MWYNNRTRCDSARCDRAALLRRDYTGICRLERKCPSGRFLSCACSIITAKVRFSPMRSGCPAAQGLYRDLPLGKKMP